MREKLQGILVAALCMLCCPASAQQSPDFLKQTFKAKELRLPYRILYPENFDPSVRYPVLFFLHGRGESGTDNERQLTHGSRLFLTDSVRKQYPAIVIFPQCPEDSYWANVKISTDPAGKRSFRFRKGGKPTKAMQSVLELIDETVSRQYIDRSRIYVGGLSMGGMGTYELLRRKPSLFAAAFAICGGDTVANVKRYRKVPLWIFHGGNDDVVSPAFSQAIVRELKRREADVKFTLYPEANHNSWDSAFSEPQLLDWLFSHKKAN